MRRSKPELTLKRYAHIRLADRAAALRKFPDLSASEGEASRKTGTGVAQVLHWS